jgi:segregation and condensation protein A
VPLDAALELPVFSGPLDLLLDLVERRKLEITTVSLATVATQYLEAVRALPEPDPDVLGEFLLIAARLLLLKSRALLPQEDEDDEDEPVDDLAERLEAYRQFKEAALALAARFELGQQAFPHPPRPGLESVQAPLAPIDAAVLARMWRSISRRQPPQPVAQPPEQPRVQIAAKLAVLRELLAERHELQWEEVAGETLDEVIASFLAVLELVRRLEILVRQPVSFGPILLQARGAAVTANRQSGASQAE